MTSPRLGATELVEAQASPETRVNAMNRHTEQGASYFIVKDKDLATPPGSPADGDCYIVAASPTGAWSGWATRIAYYSSGWISITPIEGTRAYAQDENLSYEYNGTAWGAPSSTAYTPGGTDVALADGGTGASLSDPNADRILFWDDSAGAVTWLSLGSGVNITGTMIDAFTPVTTQTGTSYTAVLADANSYVRFTNAAAVAFTIPPNSSVAFPIGTVIEFEQGGAGALTITAGVGVTLNSRGADLVLAGQYAIGAAKKVATDTWTVTGDL